MADSKVVTGLEPGGAVLVLAQEEVEGHGLGRCDQQAASAWQGGLHIEGEARGEEQEGPSGCGGPGPFDEEGVPRGLAEEGSGHAILSVAQQRLPNSPHCRYYSFDRCEPPCKELWGSFCALAPSYPLDS